MQIRRLYVKNFRNIREAEFEFHESMNVLCGNNAQGKTNLCEAITLCMGPSFRTSKLSSYIPFSVDNTRNACLIRIYFVTRYDYEKENIIEFSIKNNKKEIKYNGLEIKNAYELYGVLKYVVFIPEHLNLIKGDPKQRRDYLDSVAMMQTPVHLKKLSRYNKTLKNKNNLLSFLNSAEKEDARLQIESWNTVLAAEGLNVTYGRLKYFRQLCEEADRLYKELSGVERLNIKYYSNIFNTDSLEYENLNLMYNNYLQRLNDSFEREVKQRCTVFGVHRDDMLFFLNGANAREYGSQGQQRSIALILKLAEAEIIRKKNETPIMILDDILSELDENRQGFVLNSIENSQVFITCCNKKDIEKINRGSVWTVENGSFTQLS